jgi:hypothetical protein
VFPHDCRDLNDLKNINIAVASNPTSDSRPRTITPDTESRRPSRTTTPDTESYQQPEEPRMIGDFDGSSNALWTLFRDEAKSHDDARINTLKDGMESALIFVRSFPIAPTMDSVVLMRGLTGWFIFCCSHSIRSR